MVRLEESKSKFKGLLCAILKIAFFHGHFTLMDFTVTTCCMVLLMLFKKLFFLDIKEENNSLKRSSPLSQEADAEDDNYMQDLMDLKEEDFEEYDPGIN